MFTGDASGRFLYPTLYALGLASQPDAEHLDDGLQLFHIYITAAVRCVPPQNRPLPEELSHCHRFLVAELARLTAVRVVVSLGRIAHQAVLKALALLPSRHPFAHGVEYQLAGDRPAFLLASYHPSRQNTQTGRLTPSMFRAVFVRAMALADVEIQDPSLVTRFSSLEKILTDRRSYHEPRATTEAKGRGTEPANPCRRGSPAGDGPQGSAATRLALRPSDDPSITSEDIHA